MTDPDIIEKHLEHLAQQVRLLHSLQQRTYQEFAGYIKSYPEQSQ